MQRSGVRVSGVRFGGFEVKDFLGVKDFRGEKGFWGIKKLFLVWCLELRVEGSGLRVES